MLIEEEETFALKNCEAGVKVNDNLLAICFDFCDINDILYLSAASKKFYGISIDFDYKFEKAIEKNYFSNYTNYE
jgi:hypothetical protein